MELSYNELRKREVINVSDGRSLGKITDIRLSFPKGVLVGISVQGRRTGFICSFFDKSEIYIDESRIIKIGGDVILVDISCREDKIVKEKPTEKCPPPKQQCGECDIFSCVNGRIDTGDY